MRYVLTDGDGGTSANYDTTVTVSGVNDAPGDLHYTQYIGDSEFVVNTNTADDQKTAAITTLTDGSFVVVWESSNQDGDQRGVYFQRYDSDGVAQGSETLVNTTTTDEQYEAKITALTNGGFAVTWQSNLQDGSGDGVYTRVFDATGTAVTGEIAVNTTTANDQDDPDITALNGGGFVVVWESSNQDGDQTGIYSQRFDNNGVAQGSETLVNTTTADDQFDPSITALNDGGYIVMWDHNTGSTYELNAQRFDAGGVAVGGEFQVNTTTPNAQENGAATALTGGGFVVTWESYAQDGSSDGIIGQLYDAGGVAVGGEFQINSTTADNQTHANAIALDDGGFVVGWQSYGQDGDSWGIYAQQFDASANKVNGEVHVSESTTDSQDDVALTRLQDGRIVAVYESYGQDGSGDTIVGRILTPSLNEHSPNGTVVAVASQTVDVDDSSGFTYSLTNDAGGAFTINSSNGTITVADTNLIDFETASSMSVTVRVTDSGGLTHDEVVAISIHDVNEVPVNTVPGAQVVAEDTALALSGISVNDVDGNLSTAQLDVTQGTINVTLSGSASISAGLNGSNTLTLSGTQADINATLASLSYQGNLNYNGADTLTVTSTDSNSATDVDNAAITVTGVNDDSVITNLGGDALAYTERDGAVVIEQGADAVVSDVDSTDFDTGTLTVSFQAGSDAAEDVLGIRYEGFGAGQIAVLGSTVYYDGFNVIGTFTGGTAGSDLVVTLNANADAAAVSALINNITYQNTDTDSPTTGARTVQFTLTDGDGGNSANHDTTVTVSAVNDAPALLVSNFNSHNITTSANGAEMVVTADLDGDGDLDVLSASSQDDTIAWYENDGSENFTKHTITTSANGTESVTTADVDGDGDLDVLSASLNDDTIAWYENDGSENFTKHTITTTADNAEFVSTADVDGDGDLDVLSASSIDDTVAWYENDGSENFTKHTITNTADAANSVTTADVDGDGDLDVLSTSQNDDTVAWYENDGSENFTAHIITTSADNARLGYRGGCGWRW